MDIKSLILKLSSWSGATPPGTEKIIEITTKHPKLTIFCTTVVIGGSLYRYFSTQKYPAPWLDRRHLSTSLTKKELLETVFKEDRAVSSKCEPWDVIVVGSGLSGSVFRKIRIREIRIRQNRRIRIRKIFNQGIWDIRTYPVFTKKILQILKAFSHPK